MLMKCPYCGSKRTRVVDTNRKETSIRRRRECKECEKRFSTVERAIMITPLVIKGDDDRREPFDRQKVLSGLRIACAKRPISAEDLERVVDRVESHIRQIGKPEIPSRVIGDLVTDELKALDPVSYIRYAIVYRGLENLEAVREEVNRLLEVEEEDDGEQEC
jgi:transcriptional repressor NrdR